MKDKIPNLNNIELEAPKKPIITWLDELNATIEAAEAQKKGEKKKRKVSKKQSPACKKLNEVLYQDSIKKAIALIKEINPDISPELLKSETEAVYRRTVRPTNSENNASQVESCIQEYINRLSHCTSWKIDVKGTLREVKGELKRTTTKATKGVSDIQALCHGRFICIEIKFGQDVASDKQKEYAAKIRDSGGTYIIVRNFTDFLPKFEAWYTGKTKLNLFNQK